ncbi:EAL domain-containing protein [Trinickia violacea]|uniref:EAL domain-containing protein n=1 Tax=Trinickia violacea TaxID=2571746 RepID=UPI001C3090FC|nr:EAL domain-containing protein [Trinickia violacea]
MTTATPPELTLLTVGPRDRTSRFKSIAQSLGCRVECVGSAQELRQTLGRQRVDAVVLDPDLEQGLCFECLIELGVQQTLGSIWFVVEPGSALIKSAVTVAQSYDLFVGATLDAPVNAEAVSRAVAELPANARRASSPATTSAETLGYALIRDAVDAGRIVPYCQPIVDVHTGALVSLEMLARWRRGAGYIDPARFIPAITRMNLDDRLMHSMLSTALAGVVRSYIASGVKLSVNVSARALFAPELPDRLIYEIGDCPPASIVIEITETDVVSDAEFGLFVARVSMLRSLGFCVSVDDFGQGHASLKRLACLPVTELKIDQALTRQARDHDDARQIIHICADLARRMKLHCVLEGVETPDDMALARTAGVDAVQGYLVGRPQPLAELQSLLTRAE